MLFKEVDDCDLCPFAPENNESFIRDFKCNGDINSFHPCHYMEKYGNYTLEEVVDVINHKMYEAEAQWEKQWLAKKDKEEKAKERAKKAEHTRLVNYSLNKEITRLRKVIRKREEAIDSLDSLRSAFSITNAMFEGRPYNGDDYPENPQAIAWKKANEIDKKKLEELLKERNRRNKERRKE